MSNIHSSYLLSFFSTLLVLSSCGNSIAEKKYTQDAYQATLDSIISYQYSKIEKEFMDDFQRRKQILVKPIIDSLRGIKNEMPKINYPKDAQ